VISIKIVLWFSTVTFKSVLFPKNFASVLFCHLFALHANCPLYPMAPSNVGFAPPDKIKRFDKP
jgi:hypothetical protein